ncbi:MAG: hypothetical protein AADX96_26660, partial [Thiocapsa sp. C3-sup]|uniref:hypothetical protein n=1 Tax=Thiocapsa sp. C3-sup TaxID=3137396 RepID=UPI0035B1EC32
NPHTNGVGCAEPREAQPTVGASCASYRQHNLRVWKFAEITLNRLAEMRFSVGTTAIESF